MTRLTGRFIHLPYRMKLMRLMPSIAATLVGGLMLLVLIAGSPAAPPPANSSHTFLGYQGACSVLPGYYPVIQSGSNDSTFISVTAPPSTGGNSSSGTVWNVTVGEARQMWGIVCASAAFIEDYGRLGSQNFTVGGAFGNQSVSLSLTYSWTGTCNSSVPHGNLSLTPYSECEFEQYWLGNISAPGGTVNTSGPFESEGLIIESGGPGLPHSPSSSGGSPESVLESHVILAIVVAGGIVAMVVFLGGRRLRRRGQADSIPTPSAAAPSSEPVEQTSPPPDPLDDVF
jgi:hypothetical protein